MSQPVLFQKLTKGLFLCGKNFANFVATFNWLVDCCRNLKGDADTNNDQGHIRVTGVAQGRPIISFTGKLPSGGGGSATLKGNTSSSVEIPLEGAVVVSADDSNVEVTTSMVDGVPTIKIGVYYLPYIDTEETTT